MINYPEDYDGYGGGSGCGSGSLSGSGDGSGSGLVWLLCDSSGYCDGD